MTKELYVSSTPHETKIALVEDDQLAEIFFERENEYTLAGSIYKGRVTRVLPGMQSAFVDIGLERDAFLYVSDFLELPDDEESEFEEIAVSRPEVFVTSRPPQEPPRFLSQPVAALDSAEAELDDADTEEVTEGNTQEFAETDVSPTEGREAGSEDRFKGNRRRRRGRRRGFPETKFAPARPGSEEPEEASQPEFGPPAGHEPVILPGESLSRYRREEMAVAPQADGAGDAEGHSAPERPARFVPETATHEEAQRPNYPPDEETAPAAGERAPSTPMVLPGESIAKYRPRPAGEAPEPVEAPRSDFRSDRDRRPRREDRFERRPRTEREPREPQEFIPEGSGLSLLPGESISKYRNRPADAVPPARLQPSVAAVPPSVAPAESTVAPVQSSAEAQVLNDPHHAAREEQSHAEQAATFVIESEPWAETLEEEIAPVEPEKRSASHGRRPRVARLEREASSVAEVSEAVPEAPATSEAEARAEIEAQAVEAPAPVAEILSQAVPEAAEPVVEAVAPVDTPAAVAETPEAAIVEPLQVAEAPAAPEPVVVEPEVAPPIIEFVAAEAQPPVEAVESAVGAVESAEVAPQQVGSQSAPEGAVHAQHRFGNVGSGTLEHEEIEGEEEEGLNGRAPDDDEGDDIELVEETLESAGPVSLATRSFEPETEARRTANPDFQTPETAEYEFAETSDTDDETVFEEEELFGEEDDAEGEGEDESEDAAAHSDQHAPAPGNSSQRPDRGPGRGGDRDRNRGRRGAPRGRMVRRREPPREHAQIADLLKEGQEVLIQIAKEPIGKKGARITSHIALPGRFLVYMPTVNHVGVSRKITSDEERLRLKRIMISEREGGHGGFIVRTAAAGVGEDELRADIRFLKNLWAQIKQRAESSKAPALIYHDLNLVERVLRDQVTSDFAQIWVDTEGEYERILNFANRFQPSLVRRVKLYTKEAPLFDQFGVTEEINKAMKAKVWLKSGGYIVINQTEALVAIDINTGKYVGKTARLEDTIVKTNVDAIREIVRQIRLRDLGGIIVIDFIDMDERKNRQKVMLALEEALKSDRAPSKVLAFNDFGLVAITRKRVKQSLERTLGSPCPYCTGNGYIKSVSTICNEMYVELRKMARHIETDIVNLRVNPEVAKALKSDRGKWMADFEEVTGRTVMVRADPLLHQEQFDIH